MLQACAFATLRSSLVAGAAVALAWPLARWLASLTRRRPWALALLLIPLLTPSILIGYAYGDFALSLIRHRWANEMLYGLLLLFRATPAAVLALWLCPPPPLSDAGRHCLALLQPVRAASWKLRCSMALQGPLRLTALAGLLVFLLTFQEFEIASLLALPTWTVHLFDAQVGGLALTDSLRLALPPLALEAVLLLAVLLLAGRVLRTPAENDRQDLPRVVGPAGRMLAPAYLLLAVTGTLLIPAAIIAWGAALGARAMVQSFALARELQNGVLFALAATALALLFCRLALRLARRRQGAGWGVAASFLLSIPGLLGPLLLALLLLGLFQQAPPLHGWYDTAVPLIGALTLLLLPVGVLLSWMLSRQEHAPALHLATLLRPAQEARTRRQGASLLWRLDGQKRFWAAFLLFSLAFYDLTASSLLAPSGATPVFVRLYNLMHYGRSSVLSAMVLAAMLTPALVLALGLAAHRLSWRWWWRHG